MMKKISWHSESTKPNINTALDCLSIEYPFVANEKGDMSVRFELINGDENEYSIRQNSDEIIIEHTTLTAALRAMGSLLADADILTERSSFKTLGIMLECSRGAVMKVEHLKGWLRKLALMGYNMAMLYTTDTYQLPDEPYFGYLRGSYTQLELKEIDEYAANLGIEMIACFQTLGHLETVLKWDVYQYIRDTKHVMLVGEEKTYQLIEKMIEFWSHAYRSRRIHLGMDESHDIGLGRYLDIHGYRNSADIFSEHLDRVCNICKKYELQPMIWSDMYFRNKNKTRAYYDKDIVFTLKDKASIPKGIDLVYWDYYHDDEAFYAEWIILVGYAVVTRAEPRPIETLIYNAYNLPLVLVLFLASRGVERRAMRTLSIGAAGVEVDGKSIDAMLGERRAVLLAAFVAAPDRRLRCPDVQQALAARAHGGAARAAKTDCAACAASGMKATDCAEYRSAYNSLLDLKKLLEFLEIGSITAPDNRRLVLTEGWRLTLFENARIVLR